MLRSSTQDCYREAGKNVCPPTLDPVHLRICICKLDRCAADVALLMLLQTNSTWFASGVFTHRLNSQYAFLSDFCHSTRAAVAP